MGEIVTVTLNAALDVTYEVEALVPNATHRVTAVHRRAGDAAAAALARALLRPGPIDWPAVLADAVALSAAAVLSPVAGTVDPAAYLALSQET
ncbi:hypothetical protein AB0F88_09670 [Streptosporangium sp. NPDC023963]|uniref:hypothetical protein n=1 Tax=Streptosporangium sp. NPDC023963 TaxID=3155608 RepID=UPI00343662F8